MSKSKGNVVDPGEQLAKFGVDPVRYFLLKEGSLHRDGGVCSDCVARPTSSHSVIQVTLSSQTILKTG